MILLKLFLTFLGIGAVSFGGGYGMISAVREAVLQNGWLSEEEFMSFIAVVETTPGPLAVNMATFVGSSQAGMLGALLATLGVVLPSFVILLILAALTGRMLRFAGVNAFLSGIRPCVVALILGTAATMSLDTLLGFQGVSGGFHADLRAVFLLAFLFAVRFGAEKWLKKTPPPPLMILLSAVLGICLYPH